MGVADLEDIEYGQVKCLSLPQLFHTLCVVITGPSIYDCDLVHRRESASASAMRQYWMLEDARNAPITSRGEIDA